MSLPYLLNSLRTWRWYRYFMVCQLVLITSMIAFEIWSFGHPFNRTGLMIVESVLTFVFFMEVTLRAIFCWNAFYKSIGNIFDLVSLLTIMGLFASLVFMSSDDCGFHCGEILPMSLLAVRYIVQLGRILFDLSRCRSIRKAAKMSFDLDSFYVKI